MNCRHPLSVAVAVGLIFVAVSPVALGQCPGGRCTLQPFNPPPGGGQFQGGRQFPGGNGFGGIGNSHNQPDECPPESQQEPQNCDQVRQIAYRMAARKGYQMDGGVPSVMRRPYQIGFNDCSTGNAHMACMFNDQCTSPQGELLGLRSNSARHATTLYRSKSGRQFECDFTPQSSGIFIANRGDTRVGPAYPDPGESIDPAYDCEKNGASSSALNPGIFGGGGGGGGGGGSLQNMAIMAALMNLLRQQQDQNNQEEEDVVPDPKDDAVVTDEPAGKDDSKVPGKRDDSSPGTDGQQGGGSDSKPAPKPTPTPKPTRVANAPSAPDQAITAPQGDIFDPVPTKPTSRKSQAPSEPMFDGEEDRPKAVWEESREGIS